MAVKKDAIAEMKGLMTENSIHNAQINAEREILSIKLAELREKQGLKQEDLNSFSQTSVSKLEKRKDMKISTLLEYLDDIGMGLEISVYPKTKETEKETILKV